MLVIIGRIKSYTGYEAILLTQYTTEKGYKKVEIISNGTAKRKFVHTLVANAFLGEAPDNSYQVHHKDFKCDNNKLENLKYMSVDEHAKIHNAIFKKEV